MTIDRSGNVNFSTAETMLTTRALGATQISLQTQQIAYRKKLTFRDAVAHSELSIPKNRPRSHRIIVHDVCQRLHSHHDFKPKLEQTSKTET